MIRQDRPIIPEESAVGHPGDTRLYGRRSPFLSDHHTPQEGGPFMDRRDILADNPVEKRRGYMPGVSVSPGRILFTAGMTGRQPDGAIVPGGMAAQTQRTMERLQAILQHAGVNFSQVIKQLLYITDMEAHAAHGRTVRAGFFGEARPASTAL